MYSAYKYAGWQYAALTTLFPIWNQSVVPCPVLTVASWPAYRFLKRHVSLLVWYFGILDWYSHFLKNFLQFVVIHTVKGFGVEVDVFLELSCFLYDPMDVGNLTYGSPAFSKSNLNIWKFSVQFSHSVLSDSLRPHELQHARPPCPSPTPGVYPNSWPLNRWCHLTISSSVVPFSSLLSIFPNIRVFQMSQVFSSGGQNIGVSASTSVLPMKSQDWSPLGWTGWVSLQSKGHSINH